MELSRLGVHDSVAIDFPPRVLIEALDTTGLSVRSVGDDAHEDLSEYDAVVTFEHRESFLNADLRWVHTTAAGVDAFPLDAYAANDVVLTNSSGVHGTTVGETTIGLMLMLARRLHAFVQNQVARQWDRPAWDAAFTLEGESACIVGLGTIGRGIATRASGLGMPLTGVRRSPDPIPEVADLYQPDALHEALAEARFVVLAVPLTAETEGMIGPPEFAAMRDDAYLVNVARGAVVDEPALVTAIENHEIAGAALDVFEEEPLPPDSPLWTLDDVIISPHAAVADRAFYRAIAGLLRENLDQLRSDGTFVNRVV